MRQSNRLCNSYVVNTNPKSAYSGFYIYTCLELADPDGGTFIETIESGEEFLEFFDAVKKKT